MRKPSCSVLYRVGGVYHVFNRGHRRGSICRCDRDYEHLVYCIYRFLKDFDIVLVCFCLMPNHYHMVLKLGRDRTGISRFVQSLFTSYCSYFNRKYRLVGAVFQGRFQVRRIKGCGDLVKTVEYIKENPAEAGLVKKGEDYRWFYLCKGWNRLKV